MNRDELRDALARKRVNESLYSIDKLADQSESYSVVRDGDKWKVVYKERGEFTDIETGLTEDEACDLVYRLFRDAFCWTD
jgi:hypothetical protein